MVQINFIPFSVGSAGSAFINNGNSFGGLATLGTNDANSLAIETSGVERARFNTSGQFLVGTTVPVTAELVLFEKNQNAGTSLRINNTTVGTTSRSQTLARSDTSEVAFGHTSSGWTPANGINTNEAFMVCNIQSTSLGIITTDNIPIRLVTNAIERVRVSGSGNTALTPTAGTIALTLNGGTVTASAPVIDATQTWNNAGIDFDLISANVTNTASGSEAKLLHLQLDSSSVFRVYKSGATEIDLDINTNLDALNISINPVVGSTSAGVSINMGSTTLGRGLSIGMSSGATGSAIGIGAGTVTTSAPVITTTQTWNAGGVTFRGLEFSFTDTASAAASTLLRLRGGAGGITNLFTVDKSGNTTVAGKLTVTGAIDPPSVALSGGTALYFESDDGSTAAVAPASKGRFRYLNGTGWQVSSSGSSYATIGGITVTPYTSSTLLTSANNNGVSTNTGAAGEVILTLPSITDLGMNFSFSTTVAQYLRILASGGATINMGTSASAANGFTRSNLVGSTVKLIAVTSSKWMAFGIDGTWTVDT